MHQSVIEPTTPTVEVPRTARGWVLLGAPVLGVVLSIVFFMVWMIALIVTMKPIPADPHQIQMALLAVLRSYYGLMIMTIIIYVAVLAAIWLLLPKRGPASLQSYFAPVAPAVMLVALLSGVGFAILIGTILGLLSTQGVVSFHETSAERAMLPHGYAQLAIALSAISLVGPFVEEVYFRGLLLRWLRTKMPLFFAAIPNALLFAAIHFRFASHVGVEGIVLTGGLFLFGLFAIAWASTTNSLWPSIAAHGMYNATLIGAPLIFGATH